MFYSEGIVKYVDESNQVYLECNPELARYYRYLTKEVITLNVPRFAPHITVVRNEAIPDKTRWNEFHDLKVTFKYFSIIEHNDLYWWLPVECEFLPVIRQSLGLMATPPWENGFHLTIGNTK